MESDTGKKPDPRGTAPALVKAPAPELPKGGGAIRGIGEKFSASTFTGTGSLTVPIAVTPGRSGFQPDLALTYDSGAGNGPFGLGWRLALPNISRKTDKRLPEYRDDDDSDVFLLSGSEDLVPSAEPATERDGVRIRRYRPRVEGLFARIERHEDATGAHWVAITSSNVRNIYGRSPHARVAGGERVFSWLLERSEDSLGNVIAYEYAAEDRANVDPGPAEVHRLDGAAPVVNRYVKRIRYGNTIPGSDADCLFELVFDYGEHDAARPTPDPAPGATWLARRDPFSSYRAGFEIRTYRLCRRVLLFHRFPELGPDPCLVRATRLTYDERPTLTRLSSVVQEGYIRGAEGYTAQALPPVTFGYGEAQIRTEAHDIDAADLLEGVDGNDHQWVDLDGEGIPGVVTDDGGALWYRRNLGGGALEPPRRLAARPSLTALEGGRQQLMSLGGDGRLDLVQLGAPLPGYHERIPPAATGDGDWTPFQPFASRPDIDFTAPHVRLIDLNGDGLDDVLIAGDEVFTWYPSLGKQGFGPPRTFPRPRDEERGPALVFADATHTVFLTDLSGDGLRDLVRIGNGSVAYWPNLGHGRFGAKVTMSGAPVFDTPDQFQPSRILFADIDGSGTTDLLYLGRDGVRFWFNQSGNGWSEAYDLPGVRFDSAVSVTAVDALGSGTACLVWSSPLPGEGGARLRYIDLLGSRKPHLLESVDNGLGHTTRLRYAPSTKQYLADRTAGRPWTTRLPFPVHVLERVETYDAVSRVRFVSEYRYRDGYYDGHEREFRGFGYVEQWDTESDPALSGKGLFADRPPPVNGELPQPPVVTQTWLHTGAWLHDGLPDGLTPRLPGGLTPAESRDAYRALKGSVLRRRIRAHDGSALQDHAYLTTDHGYLVRCEQRAAGAAPAVFSTHERETVDVHAERDADDPRVRHTLALDVDPHGHVVRAATIGYPRKPGAADAQPEQGVLLATLTETDLTGETNHDDWYRHGAPIETRTYQLTGFGAAIPGRFTFEEVRDVADAAAAIAYDDTPSGAPAKRLIELVRTRYYDSKALPAPMPWGRIDARALAYETYALAFTPRMVATLYEGRVTDDLLAEGGYVQLNDGNWWVPTGRSIPEPPFYLATSFTDAFGNSTALRFDDHWLLAVEFRDARENVVSVVNDYRVMRPALITDANGNRAAEEVDALGRRIATRVMGKQGSADGDPDGDPTTRVEYAFYDGVRPNCIHSSARETHGAADTRWLHTYRYFDGGGRQVMSKTQAEPERGSTAPRWVGSGRTVFDNKGNPVKQYEPFFAPTPDYETDEQLVQQGVTPILRYDPIGRLIRRENPDGSTARFVFTPWRRQTWDEVDTLLEPGNVWLTRGLASADPLERRAARLASRHAGTPAVTSFDPLGRDVVSIDDNGPDGRYATRSEVDIEGNELVVWDALDRAALRQRFNLVGQACHQTTIDGGDKWTLLDVAGAPLRSWDAVGRELSHRYDELRRVVETRARTDGGEAKLVERTVYGEDVAGGRDHNLLGRIHHKLDGAGLVTHEEYDFKGNLTRVSRRLCADHATPPNWSDTPPPALADESFTQTTEYDALNRPARTIKPDGSELRQSYNEAGLLDSVRGNVGGADRLFAGNIDYNEKGQRLRIEYAEGASTAYEYDSLTFRLRRLSTVQLGSGKLLQDLRYAYDPVGNIFSTQDGAAAEIYFLGTVTDGTAIYDYDALRRLISAEGRELVGLAQPGAGDAALQPIPHVNDGQAVRPYVETYQYDAVGNLQLVRHAPSGATPWTRRYQYAPGSNRLAATSLPGDADDGPYGAGYGCDAGGAMTAMPHLADMEWNHQARLVRVDLAGGGTVHFAYDGLGRRARKVWEHGGVVEERIYLQGFEVYRRRQGGTLALSRNTLHVEDGAGRIAVVETETTGAPRVRFHIGNHLGSVALEIDEDGEVISYQEYHPYGTTAYRAAADVTIAANRYRYTGRERDEETGLYLHGARYYIPWLGRWASPDPAGLIDGPNLYRYVGCRPIVAHDPTGTEPEPRDQRPEPEFPGCGRRGGDPPEPPPPEKGEEPKAPEARGQPAPKPTPKAQPPASSSGEPDIRPGQSVADAFKEWSDKKLEEVARDLKLPPPSQARSPEAGASPPFKVDIRLDPRFNVQQGLESSPTGPRGPRPRSPELDPHIPPPPREKKFQPPTWLRPFTTGRKYGDYVGTIRPKVPVEGSAPEPWENAERQNRPDDPRYKPPDIKPAEDPDAKTEPGTDPYKP